MNVPRRWHAVDRPVDAGAIEPGTWVTARCGARYRTAHGWRLRWLPRHPCKACWFSLLEEFGQLVEVLNDAYSRLGDVAAVMNRPGAARDQAPRRQGEMDRYAEVGRLLAGSLDGSLGWCGDTEPHHPHEGCDGWRSRHAELTPAVAQYLLRLHAGIEETDDDRDND